MLSTRQCKRGRDRARIARWAAAHPEQQQQQTSTTIMAPAVAPGGDELLPLWTTTAAAAVAPQAAPARFALYVKTNTQTPTT